MLMCLFSSLKYVPSKNLGTVWARKAENRVADATLLCGADKEA